MKKIITLAVLMLPVLVSARYEVGQYGIAADAGYYDYSSKRHLDSGAIMGATFSYVMAPNFSGELSYDGANPESTEYNENQKFYSFMGNGVYHFSKPDSDFASYAIAGLGVTDQQDGNDDGNTKLLNINAGAGVEYFFSNSVSLFVQAVDLYTLSGGKNDWMAQGGIKCLLGPKKKVVTTPPQSRAEVTTQGTKGYYELQERPVGT
jgi:hypothetical protein